jgi:amino acid transporter
MPKEKEKKEKEYKRPEDTPGFAWRVSLSIIVFFALIVFLVVWLFFYADAFTLYQNLAVLLAAILIFIGIMGSAWAHWGIRYGRKFEKREKD